MSKILDQKNKSALTMIKNFNQSFYAKFGVFPRVIYSFDPAKIKITLEELKETVNDLISKDISVDIPKATLDMRSRKRGLVIYRQCTFKLARDMGYGLEHIGEYFNGYNHSTVIYAQNNIDMMVNNGDKSVIHTLTKIEDELEKRFGTNRTV